MSSDTLERLREQRDLLHDAMVDASQANIGRISSEYRNTLLEIDRLEKEQNAGNGKLANLLGSLASSANAKD